MLTSLNRDQRLRETIDAFSSSNDESKAVCFDYFDTIVYRNVHPEYLKQLSAKVFSEVVQGAISPAKLGALRVELERELCVQNKEGGYDLEFRIDQLARKIYREIFGKIPFKFRNLRKFTNLFIDVEISVELDHQVVDDSIFKILTDIAGSDTQLILVSDFYIPTRYMSRVLKRHGLFEFFDQIYFSSDQLITKSSGSLYKYLRGKNTKIKRFLMVGDNPHSDSKMAEENGFQSFTTERLRSVNVYEKKYNKNDYQERLKNRFTSLNKNINDLSVPFKDLAFPLVQFCKNLYYSLIQNSAETVLFMSREGEFLKKCFDQYLRFYGLDSTISTDYIIVSRKSTYICSIDLGCDHPFERLFWQYDNNSSVMDLLKSLNFSEKEIFLVRQELDINIDQKHALLSRSEALKELMDSDWFHEYLSGKIEEQRNLLNSYIETKIQDNEKNIHIVDVGWKGTIQDNLYLSFHKKRRVYGYYLGLLYPALLSENNQKVGLLFSNYQSPSEYINIYNCNRSLYEIVLGAGHGSASRYDNKYKISDGESVFEEYGANDVVSFVYVDVDEKEIEIYNTQIAKIQMSVFDGFKETIGVDKYLNKPVVSELSAAYCQFRMNYKPTGNEIKYYLNLKHLENFGIFQYTDFKNKNNIRFVDRIKNTIRFWKNPKCMLESGYWPPVVIEQNAIRMISFILLKKLAKMIKDKEL